MKYAKLLLVLVLLTGCIDKPEPEPDNSSIFQNLGVQEERLKWLQWYHANQDKTNALLDKLLSNFRDTNDRQKKLELLGQLQKDVIATWNTLPMHIRH